MKKYLLGSLLLISSAPVCAQYFPNGNFESFKSSTWNSVGAEPEGWFGSNVSQYGFVEVLEVYKDNATRPGSSGSVSVRMMNKFAGMGGAPWGANAPAYITLGSPWVKAEVPASNSDGGTYGGKEFSFKPDAIRGYIKRVLTDQAADANGTPRKDETCNIIFYSWTGHTHSTISGISSSPTIDDIKNNNVIDLDRAILQGVDGVPANTYTTTYDNFKLVSVGKFDITPDGGYADGEWHLVEIPITYKENDVVPENMNIIISAADYFNRGNIGDGNQLWADDFEFVYDSDLKSLSYDGTPINIADPENIQIAAKNFDLSKVSCTSGKGADIQKNYDSATGILTITINGNDISVNSENHNTYRVKVVPPTPEEVTGTYDRWITVNMPTPISESANAIEITPEEDGEVSFGLNEFYLEAGTTNMGPIVVPNAKLSYTGDGSISIVAENQMVAIPGLGGMKMPITLTATMSADKKLVAALNIPFGSATVNVNVGEVPFATSEENGILKVTGSVATASGAAYVKGTSTANEIDLTGANLAKGLQTSDFSTAANNLFKIADDQSLGGNNVIKNGVCDNFVLTDGQSFNAPEKFTASQITYEREVKVSANGSDEVYTFVLPFALTADQVNGTVYDLTDVKDGILDFKSVANLEANHPYLVVSNGTKLLNNENGELSGEISATNDLTHEITGKGVAMVGAYEATTVPSEGNENNESWYGYNADGKFVKAKTGTINPFRAAIKSTGIAPSSYALKLDGTVTGILNLENPNAKVDVYTIGGVCVRKNVPAASALNGLSRGVYIVGGQKVVK